MKTRRIDTLKNILTYFTLFAGCFFHRNAPISVKLFFYHFFFMGYKTMGAILMDAHVAHKLCSVFGFDGAHTVKYFIFLL
jgi:hypothetical protein